MYRVQDIKKITYANKISTNMRKLDFNLSIEKVQNKIRAFSPNPAAWFQLNNERIKIIQSRKEEGEFKASTILNNQFHIGCRDGKICPEIIQKEGKKSMQLEEFLRGFSFKVGSGVNVQN